MPFSKNVYGLSQTELYRNVDHDEDPKEILNGVAVTGLIGILRQLGDLAEFAAEIFHGIQEEVMATASRSNQLKIRLQNIEATVPPLEKAMLAQTTHIHFAYTGGIEWHPRIINEQNHLIYSDLPHFIMDPYEECRDPPRLHFLDKFDINGPGSCLKRYSDPTYFRRASSNLQGKKFQKDKKHCIIKKKRKSSSRSRDMARLASLANQSARKTFTSFSFSGQTSSTKTTSSSDMEKISDLQDHHSHSFESRSGSGYIECLSTATSSLKTGEKPKGVLVSSSLTPGSCTIASVLSECETEDAHDNFQLSPLQGKTACGSSCVSWEEKAEIVESLSRQTDEASEMMERNSVVDALDEKLSYGEGTGRVDLRSKDIENDKSESGLQKRTGIDEVREIKTGEEIVGEPRDSEHETESEGDCFVDALNAIESESENDQGLRTRQEVASSSCGVADERLEKSVCEQKIEHNSNSDGDSCRSMDGLKNYGFGKDEKSCGLVKRLSSVYTSDDMNHQDPMVSSDITRSPRNELCTSNISGGGDNIAFTFVPASENSLADSSNPLYHCGLRENQEPEAETSGDLESIKIWSNGGLLGLKPSKPPVLAVPSSLSQDCKNKERTVDSAEAEKDKSDDLVENASHTHVLNNSSLTTPGTQYPNNSDGKAMSVVDQSEFDETSFGVFGLSHKLLTNGFRRKDSFSHDRKTVPATIPENDEVTTEKRRFCYQDINEKTLMDPFRNEAPIDWITSSPPLQHMKISLNPADTFQASKLKLKFSDYNTFSSFQLLPEAATSLPDSYSDDDTFCRSSPYMSDADYLSDNHSLSNSEQWEESSDSHERKVQGLYDSFHESRHVDYNAEASTLGIDSESGCVVVNLSYLQNPAEPLPPPFPPIQWMVSKTPPEKTDDKTQSLPLQDTLRFAFEKHISLSTVNKELPNMVTSSPKPEIKVHLKNNVREEKQSANAKETETGDFLQQIRTQQFNLRPVVMTKTSSAAATTDPVINTKISAILEKANSIRQAVASNDGEESDTWSDT
ncbi:Protein SCAR3 [Cardamine amara subsp. amara]|uniref:Protein SCAR n=1 Tax=Cardamine amara subsp. amara TaxID=228776 RepID=A0ABD1B7K6_CARAN